MTRKRRVALMLDLDWPYRWHMDVFVGTQLFARQSGRWDCIVDEFVAESLDIEPGTEPPYDGVIGRATPELAEKAKQLGIPVVNVWYNSPAQKSLPGVFLDFAATGKVVAEHLLQRGFRRFACLSARSDRAHKLQRNAFHAELQAAGFECSCAVGSHRLTQSARSWRSMQTTLDEWMDGWQPPVGVFVAYTNFLGRLVADACARRGLRVPEDVALVTAMDDSAICLHPPPSLTSIRMPFEHLGYKAAELLDGLMDGRPAPPKPQLIEPLGVVVRQSTDFMAVKDELTASALEMISRHLHESISVDSVVEAVQTSRRTLERRFREHLGRSVAGEIRRLRVERAKRFLVDSEVPIKLIARKSGFTSIHRLYEAFRKCEGISPRQFRRKQQAPRGDA